MTTRDEDFNPRPGRIRHGNQGAQATEELRWGGDAGGEESGPPRPDVQAKRSAGRSTFGRGRRTALSLASRSSGPRVVVMARIVRHRVGGFRSAPLGGRPFLGGSAAIGNSRSSQAIVEAIDCRKSEHGFFLNILHSIAVVNILHMEPVITAWIGEPPANSRLGNPRKWRRNPLESHETRPKMAGLAPRRKRRGERGSHRRRSGKAARPYPSMSHFSALAPASSRTRCSSAPNSRASPSKTIRPSSST